MNERHWVLASGGLLLLLLMYSVYHYLMQKQNRVKSQEIESYLGYLSDSLNVALTTLTAQDSLQLVDSTGQHILFIGDSMAEGLQSHIQRYADQNNHRLTTVARRSASIQGWVGRDSSGRLKDSIESVRPTYVWICLGSNELFTRGLTAYRTYIKNILNQVGPTKMMWICPPNWKPDNGLTALIEEEIGTDRFFPSKELDIPRAGDAIHPTYRGYAEWTDAIAIWMMEKARHKILLQQPDSLHL